MEHRPETRATPPPSPADALSASTTDATLTADITGNSGAGGTGGTGSGSAGATGGTGSGANSDSPEQIASDQAAIDTAEAQLTNAQQSLNEATLTSPINGTVVSVGIGTGDTVSADSSTETITIIGTNSYEALATLDSSQVASVKTGQSASVEVDGVDGTLHATVAQVGPVESSSSGYSYPVVVVLPAADDSLRSGSAANIAISTGEVSHVVAVPTSAVETLGSRSYVLVLSNGELTRKVVTVGMVGDEYTQVLSGLTPGESVVLADYAEVGALVEHEHRWCGRAVGRRGRWLPWRWRWIPGRRRLLPAHGGRRREHDRRLRAEQLNSAVLVRAQVRACSSSTRRRGSECLVHVRGFPHR